MCVEYASASAAPGTISHEVQRKIHECGQLSFEGIALRLGQLTSLATLLAQSQETIHGGTERAAAELRRKFGSPG